MKTIFRYFAVVSLLAVAPAMAQDAHEKGADLAANELPSREDIIKQLKENYSEQIKIAQIKDDKAAELEAQIKLHELSPSVESRLAVIACCKKIVELKRELYKQAQVSYDEVLRAEATLLQKMLELKNMLD